MMSPESTGMLHGYVQVPTEVSVMAMRQFPVERVPALYPHEYLITEDEMGESAAQDLLLKYLVAVLDALLEREGWHVARNLTMFHPAIENSQNLISPDIALFIGIPLTNDDLQTLTSWDMVRDPSKPCPPVMIEVSSSGTWQSDVDPQHKPRLYGLMGTREYIVYDPARVWKRQGRRRLLGWRYDAARGAIPLEPDERGWLWSAELDSWLVPDGFMLRLHDRQGRRRLTEAEVAIVGQQQAIAAEWAERAARQQAEVARQQAEAHLAAWREKLRQRGIDPDTL